eukprot:7081669-Pyramimonas_sp.AAC.1
MQLPRSTMTRSLAERSASPITQSLERRGGGPGGMSRARDQEPHGTPKGIARIARPKIQPRVSERFTECVKSYCAPH